MLNVRTRGARTWFLLLLAFSFLFVVFLGLTDWDLPYLRVAQRKTYVKGVQAWGARGDGKDRRTSLHKTGLGADTPAVTAESELVDQELAREGKKSKENGKGNKSTRPSAEGGRNDNSARPDTAGKEGGKSDNARPDTARKEGVRTDNARPDTTRKEGVRTDNARPDTARKEGVRTDNARPDTTRKEGGKSDNSARPDKSGKEGGKERSSTTVRQGRKGKDPEDVDFVLFTTWIARPYKRIIHDNVLRTWPLLSPHIDCLLFSDEEDERRLAVSHGWLSQPIPLTRCEGCPVLREMMFAAMRSRPHARLVGFANGDLLFDEGMGVTVSQLVEQYPLVDTQPVLLLVCRYNHAFSFPYNITDLHTVADMKLNGKQMTDGSSDAFFTNRLFPWHHIPDIVIGRLGVAMWLVATARILNVTVIDLTPTAPAVHLTSSAGNRESHKYDTARCNHDLYSKYTLRPTTWNCGYITCAGFQTSWVKGEREREENVTGVRVVSKPELPSGCLNCAMKTKNLLQFNFPNNMTTV